MKRKTMRGGVSPSSAAESPCRPSCSEPRARTVARMVCGTPSTNSPAEACALAVPVAQISPQLWAETHCLGNRGTQHISLLRLDSSVNRYGRPAYAGNKQISQFMRPRKPVGLFGPGPDKKGDWKKRTAQHSQICNENPTARTQEKNRRFPGVWSVFPRPNLKKSQHPVRWQNSPDPNPAHIQQRSWRRRA